MTLPASRGTAVEDLIRSRLVKEFLTSLRLVVKPYHASQASTEAFVIAAAAEVH